MDVPADVLEELKCHQCEIYLSRGPVYLEHDGAASCGRCFSPKRPAIRNQQYEALAKILRFPCKNQSLGSGETVGFEDVAHEARCSYQQCVCPVLGSSRCEWLGPRSQLLQHCRAQHPGHVLDNPCSLTHDITTSSLNNYVLQAFQLLFLLLTKVCVTSGRIYHSVRLLDAENMAKDFTFTLNIKRNNEEVIKRDFVAGGGCLELEEATALGLDINSLLSVLGGWSGASCTVTVWRREKCTRCGAEVTAKGGWLCERCASIRRACENQARGCTHQDIPGKCYKHELYFCEQRTRCWVCSEDVAPDTFSSHYSSAHRNVTYNAGSTWRATRTRSLGRCCLVTYASGTAVCWYSLNDSEFDFNVYIPVLSERLEKYRCEVRDNPARASQSHTHLTSRTSARVTGSLK